MKTVIEEKGGAALGDPKAGLLTENQAAVVFNLSNRTMQAWRVRGCGPKFIKVGRSVRYRIGDLQEYVKRNVYQSTSEKSYRVNAKVFTT